MVHDDGYMNMYASEWGLIVALPSAVGPANLVCPGVMCGPLSKYEEPMRPAVMSVGKPGGGMKCLSARHE